jgi:hypothetical protein
MLYSVQGLDMRVKIPVESWNVIPTQNFFAMDIGCAFQGLRRPKREGEHSSVYRSEDVLTKLILTYTRFYSHLLWCS